MRNLIGRRPNVALLILRIGIGAIFVVHAFDKFNTGIENVGVSFEGLGIPLPLMMAWVVTFVELFGGLALIFGIGTFISAGLLIIVMIVAIFTVKLDAGLIGGYETDLALLVGLLAIMLSGPGKYSVAKKMSKKNVVSEPRHDL